MTEIEWLNSEDPQAMLGEVHVRMSGAQLREFAVSCCRRISDLVEQADAGAIDALLAAERSIRSSSTSDPKVKELLFPIAASAAGFAAAAVSAAADGDLDAAKSLASHSAYSASALTGTGYADDAAMVWSVAADAGFADEANTNNTERIAQAELLRRIVGNPFKGKDG